MKMEQYWIDRYTSQGLRTVGNVAFSEERFGEVTRSLEKRFGGFFFEHFAGKDVLDFGCGYGRLSEMLFRVGMANTVTGVDIVPWALEQARKKVIHGSFVPYDGKVLPFKSDSFDVVLTWTVLQHVPPSEVENVAAELSRVIKLGGELVLFENISTLLDKKHIWFRAPVVYRAMFPELVPTYMNMIDLDGLGEVHMLMVLKKGE